MSSAPRFRLGVLGVVALTLFLALFVRLWFLQVMAAPDFQVAAETNRVRIVQEPAVRGRILDRTGEIVVDNRQSTVVTVERAAIDDPEERAELFSRLAPILGTEVERLEARYGDARYSRLLPLPLATDVPESTVVELAERPDEFPGVRAELVAVREYPYGELLAHVLGYVGEINEEELETLEAEGYVLGDEVGKTGVERVYEQELRGEPGITKFEVDSSGEVLRVLSREPSVPGNDVVLSVDIDVQALAERVLADALIEARGRRANVLGIRFAAPAGALVVLDPRDGSVVAMASHPTYDPRLFVNGISQRDFARLNDPANHFPLNNRAIQGLYAPGSTFKLVTAVAAMQYGLIDATTTIADDGVFEVPGCEGEQCTFRDGGGGSGGALIDLRQSLTISSDVFYYKLGADFWLARDRLGLGLQATAEQFGMGTESGVPLPDEAAGRVPTPESKQRLHEENPDAFPFGEWFTGDNVNLSIGQGDLLVTPLQLANAYATFANGGSLLSPNVALRVQRPDGEVVREFGPRVLRTIDMPPDLRGPILDGLRQAVANGDGTAARPFRGFPLDEYPLAGKTGTAQTRGNEDQYDTSLFTAFGPVTEPQYVVTAVLEEAGFGAEAAAPAVRRMFDALAGFEPVPEAPRAEPLPPSAVPAGADRSTGSDDPTATTSTLDGTGGV